MSDHNRGFDNGVLGGQRHLTGSFAEQQGYDASRAIFDANRPTGAAASSYSPGVEKALAIIGPVP